MLVFGEEVTPSRVNRVSRPELNLSKAALDPRDSGLGRVDIPVEKQGISRWGIFMAFSISVFELELLLL
jgi:hypothetical protein